MKYILDISYKGTDFKGWQIQPQMRTVQGLINEALSTILRQNIDTLGSGRTDTGVHANQQIVHFDFDGELPQRILKSLNSLLPADIVVHYIKATHDDFHARFDAKYRSYKYYIIKHRDPFKINQATVFWQELNIDLMNQACQFLLKNTDFEAFSKVKTEVNNFNCDIMQAEWVQEEEVLVFYIRANRFLRGMVRAIVGTMLDVGTYKTSLAEFEEIIQSKKRIKAGQAAPAHGLFLDEVVYDRL